MTGVHDHYQWIAGWYDLIIEPVLASARRLGLELAPPGPGMVVLDVGCGTGAQLALYRSRGCTLLGIDPSRAMVEVARTRLGWDARVDLADASRMPYGDASVDLALASMMLHELADDTRAAILGEIRRVLTPGGRLVVFDYHPGPLRFPRGWVTAPFILAAERLAGRDHYRHHREFLAAGGTPAFAARHGFRVDAARSVKGGNFGVFVLVPVPGPGDARAY